MNKNDQKFIIVRNDRNTWRCSVILNLGTFVLLDDVGAAGVFIINKLL